MALRSPGYEDEETYESMITNLRADLTTRIQTHKTAEQFYEDGPVTSKYPNNNNIPKIVHKRHSNKRSPHKSARRFENQQSRAHPALQRSLQKRRKDDGIYLNTLL